MKSFFFKGILCFLLYSWFFTHDSYAIRTMSNHAYNSYVDAVRHNNPNENKIDNYTQKGRDTLQRLGDKEHHNRKVDEQKNIKKSAKEVSRQSKPPINITKITQADATDANDLKLLQMQNKYNKKRVANKTTKGEKKKEK